jgi:beta-galactosidase
VDLYGDRKPSFEALRLESSPIQTLELEMKGNQVKAHIATRKQLPAYRLDGYRLRWIVFGYENLPMEQNRMDCPALLPGTQITFNLPFKERDPHFIRVDLLRPTGYSVATTNWKRR